MDKIIKKEFLKQCELFFTKEIKQFIMGKPIKINNVNKSDGTSYKRTEKTHWPVNEISRKNAKLICRKLVDNKWFKEYEFNKMEQEFDEII